MSTTDLPFVCGMDLWVTTPAHVWADDNATGRQYADALVDYAGPPSLLCFVVQAMGPKDHWSGIEVGFFHRLSERAAG
jgi:hypothetical protein